MSTRSKSPLHPSALSLNDIHPGRRIILFNKEYGNAEEAVVVSRPYILRQSFDYPTFHTMTNLVVDLRSVKSGRPHTHHLTDMGVIPYIGSSSNPNAGWNPVNFTIDARKHHLLPAPDPSLHDSTWDELDRLIEAWEDELLDY